MDSIEWDWLREGKDAITPLTSYLRQTALLVLYKIAKSLLYYAFHGPPRIFLTLASVNNQLQIFSNLVFVNIAQARKCGIPDSDASE
jgi:hypothetical protein